MVAFLLTLVGLLGLALVTPRGCRTMITGMPFDPFDPRRFR